MQSQLKQIKLRNIYVGNCKVFVFALTVAYTGLAVFVCRFLPDTFYTFSSFQRLGEAYALVSMFVYLFFFYVLLTCNPWILRQDYFTKLLQQLSKMCFFVALLQWLAMAFLGVVARFAWGMDRGALLEFQHQFLISGVSFIYIFAFVYLCRVSSGKLFLFVCFLFICIDFLYMGKKFVFYLMAVGLFRFDGRAIKKTIVPAMITLAFGVAFAALIYVFRAIAGSGNVLVDLYTLFSEFVGVLSTVGFSIQYGSRIESYWLVIQSLEPFYFDSVGHGLALHPTAYFVAVGGENWLAFMLLCMVLFSVLFYFFSMLLGDLVLLVLLANIIHFFRHGPDIFLFQFITQAIVLSSVSYFGLFKIMPHIHKSDFKGGA